METNDRILREGQPFQIALSTAGDAIAVDFVLDSDSYGGVSGFFKDKMLWISGFKVVTGAASTIEKFTLDEIVGAIPGLVWAPNSLVPLAEGIDLSGTPSYDVGNSVEVPPANIESKYGQKFLPCRNKFTLKNLAGSTDISTIYIWGVYTKRNM